MNSTQAHFNISAREIGAKLKPHGSVHFGYSRSSGLALGRVYFDDVTVFRLHCFLRAHLKRAFSKSIVFNRSTLESLRMAPFSVIVLALHAVWTIVVSGAKQLRFRLKTD